MLDERNFFYFSFDNVIDFQIRQKNKIKLRYMTSSASNQIDFAVSILQTKSTKSKNCAQREPIRIEMEFICKFRKNQILSAEGNGRRSIISFLKEN